MSLEHVTLHKSASSLESWVSCPPDPIELAAFTPKGNVLLVDGPAKGFRYVRSFVHDAGRGWLEAANPEEALAAISLHRIDLVLVNAAIAEQSGIEFCRMLKRATATRFLPVFILSASDDPETEVAALEAGADEFVSEPVRARALLARVEAILRQKLLIDSLDDSESVLFSLAQSVEERDPGLGQHCQRLARMAAAMGLALGLPPADVLALQRGGFLHDIGKVAVPDSVLFKAGPLTPEEWDEMRTHAERGERICSNMRSLASVLPIIRHHHEKWNGTGYPDALAGEEIPLLARIFQVVDVYDALTTARPYKRALSPGEALDIMREETRKGWRDPVLVEKFAELLPLFDESGPADFTRLSLHALAASVEKFRKSPAFETRRAPVLAGARERQA